MELNELIMKVFTQPPKDIKSINVEFINSNMTMRDIYDLLITFTVGGMRVLYSDDGKTVDVSKLTLDNIEILKKYLASIGFNLIINKYSKEEFNRDIFPYYTPFNNMPYDDDVKNLSIYTYNISDRVNLVEYIISYDFL